MPRRSAGGNQVYEASLLAKASHWVAESMVRLALPCADYSAKDARSRSEAEDLYLHRVGQAQQMLALALEAYGEVVRSGDLARAERAIAEMEIPWYADRRPVGSYYYIDPIASLDDLRHIRRKVAGMKKQLEKMKSDGTTRGQREIEREIEALEKLIR